MAEYCADGRFRVTRIGPWGAVDHYAPKPGKSLTLFEYDTSRFSYDKNHWGFGGLEISAGYIDAAIAAGFSAGDLIVGIGNMGWSDAVDLALSKGATKFYIDEPYGQEGFYRDARGYIYARGGVLTSSDWDTQYGPLCIASGFPRLQNLRNLALEVAPYQNIGCNTSFTDSLCGVDDPRNQWTWLKNNSGGLFDFAWIKTRENVDRMNLLFGHANNIGLTKLRIYVEDSYGLPDRRVDVLCDTAWHNGWLRKFVKEILQTWCCTTQTYNPDSCYLESMTETGNVVEI
ncbi:MAG: hypothetical protein Q8P51_17575 [Ignavibacteria bacterium]|nr:hypothetical protein [Ignavibacteria bacterium]